MLTLFTGTPGAGKTALVVSELVKVVESGRRVIVMGIPELQVPHELAPPVEKWTRLVPTVEDPNIFEAEFVFPEGSLVVIDEAQKVFRPRSVGSKVPDHVSAFEKHRHRGLDFWLITQHPNLLDAAVRKLIGKHVHLRGHWAGRELLEWPEAADPSSKSERASAVRVRYKLPKKVFSLYKSASLHVKQKRRVPKLVYVLVGLVGLVGYLGWRSYDRVAGAISGEPSVQAAAAEDAPVPSAVGAAPPRVDHAGAGLSLASFVPRLAGRAETAPLYDGIRQVVALPVVAGCMAIGKRCSCYTEQGSDSGYSVQECRAWLESPPFNPYRATLPAPSRQAGSDRVPLTGGQSPTGRTAIYPGPAS